MASPWRCIIHVKRSLLRCKIETTSKPQTSNKQLSISVGSRQRFPIDPVGLRQTCLHDPRLRPPILSEHSNEPIDSIRCLHHARGGLPAVPDAAPWIQSAHISAAGFSWANVWLAESKRSNRSGMRGRGGWLMGRKAEFRRH